MNQIKRLRLIFLLCGLFLPFSSAFAAVKVLDASLLDTTHVSLTEYFTVLEDPSLTLIFADVQKSDIAARFKMKTAAGDALSFGYTRSAYWLRLTLRNGSELPLERMLELGYAGLASVQIHQPFAQGMYDQELGI